MYLSLVGVVWVTVEVKPSPPGLPIGIFQLDGGTKSVRTGYHLHEWAQAIMTRMADTLPNGQGGLEDAGLDDL